MRAGSAQLGPTRFVLQGPSGWNSGQPYAWQSTLNAGVGIHWEEWGFRQIPAVAGSYTLRAVTDGVEISASFSISPTQSLARTSTRVASTSPDRVTVMWTAVPGALSYAVSFWDLQARVARHFTRETAHTFEGLSLRPGTYRVIVNPASFDVTQPITVLPPQINISAGDNEFAVR